MNDVLSENMEQFDEETISMIDKKLLEVEQDEENGNKRDGVYYCNNNLYRREIAYFIRTMCLLAQQRFRLSFYRVVLQR